MERNLELIMISKSIKKVVNKVKLFPTDRNSDSINQNEGFVKNMRFNFAKKLLSPAETSFKENKKLLPIRGESLLHKSLLQLRLNNVFH